MTEINKKSEHSHLESKKFFLLESGGFQNG